MQLLEIRGGALALLVLPDDLITLAEACRYAADDTQERTQNQEAERTTSFIFHTLACMLDALALVAHAAGMLRADEIAQFTLPTIAREWGVLPEHRRTA